MSTILNNFIKYNSTIRTLIQILYEFRIRKTLNLLRINNPDSSASKTTSKTKNVTITIYPAIIRSATAENDIFIETGNDSSTNRISLFKIIISIRRELITSPKETFFIKETPFIETSRIVIMNEYRPSHIDIKNVIVFAFLKMKKVYNARH